MGIAQRFSERKAQGNWGQWDRHKPNNQPKERGGPFWTLWVCENGLCVDMVDGSTDAEEILRQKEELEGALREGESLVIFNLGG